MKWDYLVETLAIEHDHGFDPGTGLADPDAAVPFRERLARRLHAAGEDEWELVDSQVIPFGKTWVLVFKRPRV